MIKFWKRHKIRCLLLFILAYLLIGATAPFMIYRKLQKDTLKEFDPGRFRSGAAGTERAALLETNLSAWEERLRLLDRAKERIILATFDMREGKSSRDILSVLLAKAEEGVKVQILVDGVSGLIQMEGHELFYALSSHPNVEIKIYNKLNLLKPWTLQGRMHDKYVIVDQEAYILGGRNTFDYFIGNYTKKNVSYDREVLVYNTEPESAESSLLELLNYFEGVWSQKDCKLFHDSEKLAEKEKVKEERAALEKRYQELQSEFPELFDKSWNYEEHTFEAGEIHLLSNPTHVNAKEPVLFASLMKLMKTAEERVVIQSPYVVCNRWMNSELSELGKAVPDSRILLNAVENGDNFVASSDYLFHKKEIIETGIPLYEYDGGTSNHGKSILIDSDLSLIGSYNLDLRSTYLDTELMVVIESRELNAQLSGYLKEMEEDSRRVIDKDTFEAPEDLKIQEASAFKRMAWTVFGFIMQPFRSLI